VTRASRRLASAIRDRGISIEGSRQEIAATKASTVLRIDDELEVRTIVSRLLQRAGHEEVTAAIVAEALAMARFVRAGRITPDTLVREPFVFAELLSAARELLAG
jgi:hypothetical protein